VDASNIERNMYLTTQVVEMGLPMVIALNMMDVVRKRGTDINISQLSECFGDVPIVEISALNNTGIDQLVEEVDKIVDSDDFSFNHDAGIRFDKKVENTIDVIYHISEKYIDGGHYSKRWLAIKLLEEDEKILEKVILDKEEKEIVAHYRDKIEDYYDDDIEGIIADQRYLFITQVISKAIRKTQIGNELSISDKVDKILTNRILALPIFLVIMWLIYAVSISWIGPVTIGWVEMLFEMISEGVLCVLAGMGISGGWLESLIIDGIIGGVGGILVFVPQLMILFLFISILEDSGYMARVAFIMDRIFKRFGLSGKSFIPLIIGTGCSVPGIMASRTIENQDDRRMTIMMTPFIPCGAKIPMIALLTSAFFADMPWVAPSMYLIGIALALMTGIILKKTPLFNSDPAPFIMELPEYRLPKISSVLLHMWEKGKDFVIKAGTVILAASIVIWFLSNFSWTLQMVAMDESILAGIGRLIAPLFVPLGFGFWEATVASMTGLLAKEAVVGTLGVVLNVAEGANHESIDLISALPQYFTALSAYTFMIFNLFSVPCVAALGAMKREFNSWKWLGFAVLYEIGIAYILGLIIYQAGNLFL
jgi:ferrous iron transport protein B